MYIVFKTENGETVVTEYTVAYYTNGDLFIGFEEIDLENREKDRIKVNGINMEENIYSAIDTNTGLGMYIEILEMVPDMRKYL